MHPWAGADLCREPLSWVAEGLESQPSSQGTLPWQGTVFYPVVIFFSYLGSVSVCLLWARARLVSYRKSTCCCRGWGRVGGIPPLLPWQDFGSCVCPVHTLRIPEPSPSSLMTLQVLHVPQGRWAEGTTVGPHNSPSPKLLEVQLRLGSWWGVTEQCGSP